MSTQYPGGFITKSPVAPTITAASGIWTVDQALQYVKAGTWPSPPVFIEDVFSTYLYTGNGSTQTITNNVNLSTGGMVWLKSRSSSVYNHFLIDTARGVQSELSSNNADFANTATGGYDLTAFTSTGFTLGPVDKSGFNNNGSTQASWSFKKQPFFFDIVTYTGTGANRTISHNLGSVPGCIIVKQTAPSSTNWQVYHRSLANTQYMVLNSDAAVATGATRWNSTTPTASVFSVGTDSTVNASGSTYVAYLFAHDAGGFMGSGGSVTNGISCGSYTTDGGANATVTLGYEPQFLLIKQSSTTGDWQLLDSMRGIPVGASSSALFPNLTAAETSGTNINLTATGFKQDASGSASATYIYIAIRRGPMKTPTVGTSVFSPIAVNAATGTAQTTNFVPDMQLLHYRDGADSVNNTLVDRLRGVSTNATSGGLNLKTSNASAEGASVPGATLFWNNTGFQVSGYLSNVNSLFYSFSRAPNFFDVVCYKGTGSVPTVNHNLNVAPELIILKSRSAVGNWPTNVPGGPANAIMFVDLTDASYTGGLNWSRTSATFTPAGDTSAFAAGTTYVAYLFATCPGVSKVGSYTGTAALQTINCGFTTGARFVLIKRTNSTGDWYVWDSARGISSSTDPYYLVNTNAADVTGTNYVDTDTTGFKVTAAAPAALNASGGSYIFLAIA